MKHRWKEVRCHDDHYITSHDGTPLQTVAMDWRCVNCGKKITIPEASGYPEETECNENDRKDYQEKLRRQREEEIAKLWASKKDKKFK